MMAILKWDSDLFTRVNTEKAQKELIKLGMRIERSAKRVVPVDTGRLKASITTAWYGGTTGVDKAINVQLTLPSIARGIKKQIKQIFKKKKHDITPIDQPSDPLTVKVGTNVEYAKSVELGTAKQRSQPFLRPAFNHELKNSPFFRKVR